MTSWLVFHGSCGHIERIKIDHVQWASMTSSNEFTTRIGRVNRAVYVYPNRFYLCSDCCADELMATGHA